MDVGIAVDSHMPWEIEPIENKESYLFRLIPAFKRIGKRPRKYPSEACFALRKHLDEKSISFNWDKYADNDTNFILRGITLGHEGNWIDCSSNVLFKYKVEFLQSLKKFEKIEHSPDWFGNPSPVGQPNNKSHALLFCGDFDDGTRLNLSDYSLDEYDKSFCEINLESIREEINRLRQCDNDTPYHKDWEAVS